MLPTSEKVKVAAARILLNRMDNAAMEKIAAGIPFEQATGNLAKALKGLVARPGFRIPTAAGVAGLGSLLFTGDEDLEDRLKIMALAGAGGAAAGSTPEIIKMIKGWKGKGGIMERGAEGAENAMHARVGKMIQKQIRNPSAKGRAEMAKRIGKALPKGWETTVGQRIRGTGKAPGNLEKVLRGLYDTPGARIPLSALLGGGIGAGVAGLTDQDVAGGALIGGGAGALAGVSPEIIRALRRAYNG